MRKGSHRDVLIAKQQICHVTSQAPLSNAAYLNLVAILSSLHLRGGTGQLEGSWQDCIYIQQSTLSMDACTTV